MHACSHLHHGELIVPQHLFDASLIGDDAPTSVGPEPSRPEGVDITGMPQNTISRSELSSYVVENAIL